VNRVGETLAEDGPGAVDDLLTDVLTRPAREQGAVLDRVCAQHPGLAATLRHRHAALARLGLLSEHGLAATPAAAFDADADLPRRLGEYELLECIGNGGMGVVYRARHCPLGREVALKVMRPELAASAPTRTRFRHEAQAIARLDHTNIVPVHTVGEAFGVPFLVMPLLEGRSLAELLACLQGHAPATITRSEVVQALTTHGKVALPTPPAWLHEAWTSTVVRIVLHVAEALTHAHGRGVVHRDVKPANVMLASDGRVLLVDFGLASVEEHAELTRPGMVMGSLAYASPEQAQGQKVDARTDVFALGVVLYEMLTLVAPFAAHTTQATVQRVLTHEPPDVRRHNPAVGADLAAIVRKALEKDRRARYASMAALAADLRGFVLGGVLSVRPDTTCRRACRFVRRRPLQALLLALTCAILLIAAGWAGYWYSVRETLAVGRNKQVADATQAHVLAGFVELASEHRAQARSAFHAALALDPACAEAAVGLAIVARTQPPEPCDPEHAPAHELWREATWMLARGCRDDGSAARAAELAEQAVLRARTARPLYFLTWLHAAAWAQDHAAVARATSAALVQWPMSAHVHFYAGSAQLQTAPRQAVASLQRALELDPDHRAARAELGNALFRSGDTAAAETTLREIIATQPDNARAWLTLGQVCASRGDLGGARVAYAASAASNPALPGAHYHLALALQASGDQAGAIAAYEQTLRLAPDYWQAHKNLGLLLADAAQYEPALHHLRRLAALQPDDAEAQRCLAYACTLAGDEAGALAAYAEIARLCPADATAHALASRGMHPPVSR
jgi:serine/threonine protein kinase/Flp pilus assembly protein TadD